MSSWSSFDADDLGVERPAVALRFGDVVLDASADYVKAPRYADEGVVDAFRWFNSEVHYESGRDLVLLRALQRNSVETRSKFFDAVRSLRRRFQGSIEGRAVERVLRTKDEYKLLRHRAAVERFRALLRDRGLYLQDAFQLFDHDGDAFLTPDELYGGIEWLGINMSSEQVRELVSQIDENADGEITWKEFRAAFHDAEETDWSVTVDPEELARTVVMPKPLLGPSLGESGEGGEEGSGVVEEEIVTRTKVKTLEVDNFVKLWTSKGTGARSLVSLWAPDVHQSGLTRLFHQRTVGMCMGVYGSNTYKSPSKDELGTRFTAHIKDKSASRVTGSKNLGRIMAEFFPFPIRFHEVWRQTRGEEPLYAWRAVPPSDDFVVMGMMITKGPDPPALDSMRCVLRSLVVPASMDPVLLWSDEGTGGAAGSMWSVNSMGLVWVVAGAGEGGLGGEEFWEMREPSFYMGVDDCDAGKSAAW